MQGKRVHLPTCSHHLLEAGEYYKDVDTWYANSPNDLTANLGNHSVIEHDDGTITVSPSILVTSGKGNPSWHGFLEHGVWREC